MKSPHSLARCVESIIEYLELASDYFSEVRSDSGDEDYFDIDKDFPEFFEKPFDDIRERSREPREDRIDKAIDLLRGYLENPHKLVLTSARQEISNVLDDVFIEELPAIRNRSKSDLSIGHNWIVAAMQSSEKLYPTTEVTHHISILTDDTSVSQAALASSIAVVNAELLRHLGPDPSEWLRLPPRRFEEILAEIWRGLGWQTYLTPPTNDGGFDVRAVRNENGIWCCYLIEAKAYAPTHPVGVGVVRALHGTVEKERASKGIIATTSRFTSGAMREADALRYRMSLADFNTIMDWVREYQRIKGHRT